jgi:hypothetical protein
LSLASRLYAKLSRGSCYSLYGLKNVKKNKNSYKNMGCRFAVENCIFLSIRRAWLGFVKD